MADAGVNSNLHPWLIFYLPIEIPLRTRRKYEFKAAICDLPHFNSAFRRDDFIPQPRGAMKLLTVDQIFNDQTRS